MIPRSQKALCTLTTELCTLQLTLKEFLNPAAASELVKQIKEVRCSNNAPKTVLHLEDKNYFDIVVVAVKITHSISKSLKLLSAWSSIQVIKLLSSCLQENLEQVLLENHYVRIKYSMNKRYLQIFNGGYTP